MLTNNQKDDKVGCLGRFLVANQMLLKAQKEKIRTPLTRGSPILRGNFFRLHRRPRSPRCLHLSVPDHSMLGSFTTIVIVIYAWRFLVCLDNFEIVVYDEGNFWEIFIRSGKRLNIRSSLSSLSRKNSVKVQYMPLGVETNWISAIQVSVWLNISGPKVEVVCFFLIFFSHIKIIYFNYKKIK